MNLVPTLDATLVALTNAGVSQDIIGDLHPGKWTGDPRGPWFTTVSGRRVHLLDPHESELDLDDVAHGLSAIPRFGGHVGSVYEIPHEPTRLYTVAQHSVLVMWLACMAFLRKFGAVHAPLGTITHEDEDSIAIASPPPHQHERHIDLYRLLVAALAHDGSEAYLGDMIRPLKQLFPLYKVIENNLSAKLLASIEATCASDFALRHSRPLPPVAQQAITLPTRDAKTEHCLPLETLMVVVKNADRLALHIERDLYTPNPPRDIDPTEQIGHIPSWASAFLEDAHQQLALGNGIWTFDRARERYADTMDMLTNALADTIGDVTGEQTHLHAQGYDLTSFMNEVRLLLIS